MAKCILVADDNDIVRTVIRFFLETKGFEVCGEAADGVHAIEKAQQLKPDLIVLDVAMPRMNGDGSSVRSEGYDAGRANNLVHDV